MLEPHAAVSPRSDDTDILSQSTTRSTTSPPIFGPFSPSQNQLSSSDDALSLGSSASTSSKRTF